MKIATGILLLAAALVWPQGNLSAQETEGVDSPDISGKGTASTERIFQPGSNSRSDGTILNGRWAGKPGPGTGSIIDAGKHPGNSNLSGRFDTRSKKPGPFFPTSRHYLEYLVDEVVAYSTDTTRDLYSYDEGGHMTLRLSENWLAGQWVQNKRLTTTYDPQGNTVIQLVEEHVSNEWVNSTRDSSVYDSRGNELEHIRMWWRNNQWAILNRDTLGYDENGNELLWGNQYLANGEWTDVWRHLYEFDGQGNMIRETYVYWLNGAKTNEWRTTYTYDADGYQAGVLNENWQDGRWNSSTRYTYEYNQAGLRTNLLGESWTDGSWSNSWRSASMYDDNGNLISWVSQYWQGGQWLNNSRQLCTYDQHGNLLTWMPQPWQDGEWVKTERDSSTYDANGNLVLYLHEVWEGSSWFPSVGTENNDYIYFNSNGVNYSYEGYQVSFSWDLKDITNVESGHTDNPETFSLFQNYPNPFNPQTTITYNVPKQSHVKLIVYDIVGRIVATLVDDLKAPGEYSVNFDGGRLASGVYFCRFNAGRFTATTKLMLVK